MEHLYLSIVISIAGKGLRNWLGNTPDAAYCTYGSCTPLLETKKEEGKKCKMRL